MPSIFDFLEMLPEPAKGLLPVGIAEFVLEFFESEVDNVMVMDFLGRQVATQFQPNAMHAIEKMAKKMTVKLTPEIVATCFVKRLTLKRSARAERRPALHLT